MTGPYSGKLSPRAIASDARRSRTASGIRLIDRNVALNATHSTATIAGATQCCARSKAGCAPPPAPVRIAIMASATTVEPVLHHVRCAHQRARLVERLVPLGVRHRVVDDAAACLHEQPAVLDDGGAQRDRRVHVVLEADVADGARGVYAGAVGYISFQDDMDTA